MKHFISLLFMFTLTACFDSTTQTAQSGDGSEISRYDDAELNLFQEDASQLSESKITEKEEQENLEIESDLPEDVSIVTAEDFSEDIEQFEPLHTLSENNTHDEKEVVKLELAESSTPVVVKSANEDLVASSGTPLSVTLPKKSKLDSIASSSTPVVVTNTIEDSVSSSSTPVAIVSAVEDSVSSSSSTSLSVSIPENSVSSSSAPLVVANAIEDSVTSSSSTPVVVKSANEDLVFSSSLDLAIESATTKDTAASSSTVLSTANTTKESIASSSTPLAVTNTIEDSVSSSSTPVLTASQSARVYGNAKVFVSSSSVPVTEKRSQESTSDVDVSKNTDHSEASPLTEQAKEMVKDAWSNAKEALSPFIDEAKSFIDSVTEEDSEEDPKEDSEESDIKEVLSQFIDEAKDFIDSVTEEDSEEDE